MSIYLRLFWEFFKTGLFAVGGGMATLPFLKDIGTSTGWYTYSDLMNMLAVSESTPGPIGINMATYVGFTVAGLPGAVIATLGEVTPSIIVILIIARILNAFRENKLVQNGFYGLRPASTALIGSACLTVAFQIFTGLHLQSHGFWNSLAISGIPVRWNRIILAVVLLFLTSKVEWFRKCHPIVLIGISAAVGALFGFARN